MNLLTNPPHNPGEDPNRSPGEKGFEDQNLTKVLLAVVVSKTVLKVHLFFIF